MTQWCQLKRQCHKFPRTLTYLKKKKIKSDSRRRASSGDFWHIRVIKKCRPTFYLFFWCYSRAVWVSAALRLMITVACHVFMSACQVIPVLRLSQFFLRGKKKALSELPGKLWWVRALASWFDWNVSSLVPRCLITSPVCVRLEASCQNNNLQTCRLSFGCDICCFPFLSDLLCRAMLMFSSHVAVFTWVKDCLMIAKQCAAFSW